jgi:glycosyltransferase involved in cell wall biosynthesis
VNGVPRAVFLFRDSPLRREALAGGPGALERYSLYGLDEVAAGGIPVRHNLEPQLAPSAADHRLAWGLDRFVRVAGGYSGDFASVLGARGELNRSDVVFSTVDTVGIPLVLLRRFGLVRAPVVYAAIGLPERLAQLRGPLAKRVFREAFGRVGTIVAYGWGEAEELGTWLADTPARVEFVPFGVDTESFRPEPAVAGGGEDVVSVGADPRRDFRLLVQLAQRLPERTFRIVTTREHTRTLGDVPANVRLEVDVPLARVRERLQAAGVVVLPVRANTYSGATTTMLQAMACGKPVVVTETAAIEHGYRLEDGVNVQLVHAGDLVALDAAVTAVLSSDALARGLGLRARETVEHHFTWERYAGRIRDLLLAACATTVSA